jgi:hypothetical protein
MLPYHLYYEHRLGDRVELLVREWCNLGRVHYDHAYTSINRWNQHLVERSLVPRGVFDDTVDTELRATRSAAANKIPDEFQC